MKKHEYTSDDVAKVVSSILEGTEPRDAISAVVESYEDDEDPMLFDDTDEHTVTFPNEDAFKEAVADYSISNEGSSDADYDEATDTLIVTDDVGETRYKRETVEGGFRFVKIGE